MHLSNVFYLLLFPSIISSVLLVIHTGTAVSHPAVKPDVAVSNLLNVCKSKLLLVCPLTCGNLCHDHSQN